MPRRFLSEIIDALLGREEEGTKKGEAKEVPQAGIPTGRKVSAPPASGAKEWVPDFAARIKERASSEKAAAPAKKENEGQQSAPEHERNIYAGQKEGGIKNLAENAFSKAIKAFSDALKRENIIKFSPFLAAALIVLALFTPFLFYIKAVLIVIVLILAAALSKLIQKLFPFVVGFDLCLFFTVIVGVAYHPLAGMAVGVASSAMGSIIRGQYSMDKVVIPLLGYVAVSLLIPMMPFSDIFNIGVILALIYAVMMSVIFWFIMHSPFDTATFLVTSLAFNYWLFLNYAAPLLSLLGG